MYYHANESVTCVSESESTRKFVGVKIQYTARLLNTDWNLFLQPHARENNNYISNRAVRYDCTGFVCRNLRTSACVSAVQTLLYFKTLFKNMFGHLTAA